VQATSKTAVDAEALHERLGDRLSDVLGSVSVIT
jgi:hypothetical protein